MKRIVLIALFSVAALSLNSCALMFNGSKKDVSVKSMTPDAKIYVNGNYVGDDAVTVNLKRKSNHTVMIEKEGCRTETVQIRKETQAGWIVFDALFNWLAFLTDAPTGAWNTLEPENVVRKLDCEEE
jgi:hypothetical protein